MTEHVRAKGSAEQRLRKAIRAIKIAESVMSYCAGDQWEAEVTSLDRAKFNKLFEALTGKVGGA